MLRARQILQPIAGVAAGGLAWGLFEAQWIEFNELEVRLARLPAELDGFTIVHLADFHLGTFSLNGRTLDRAVTWAVEQDPDLVVLTGDLLSRQRGDSHLRTAIGRLRARHGVFAVLGNHDVDATRDPFSTPTDASAVSEAGAVLLGDASAEIQVDGRRVQIVGGDPRRGWKTRRLERLADPAADLRVLLFHFPDVVEWLPPGAFDLVLAGHLHGGQICLPTPGGKVRLEHLRSRHWEGLHETPAGMLHVSRGVGTSFVPFRFLARPEVTKLVLRCPTGSTP
jgi:predicted MPP superfamily phosphohydrolase